MAQTAIATFQTIWDCKWSRLAYPFVTEPRQPDSLWVCVRRDGPPRSVGEQECATCPFWEATDEREC
jgi:hypothetical protein